MPHLTPDQAFQIALRHFRAGQLEQAEQICRQIIDRHPDHLGALHFLGVIAAQTGRNEVASNLLSQVITLKPDWPEAHSDLGNVLQSLGRFADAMAAFSRAIALRPNFLEAHYNLGNLLSSQQRFGEAIMCYRQALVIRPDYVNAQGNLANTLKDAGHLDEAIAAYRRLIALTPGQPQPEAHRNLGLVLLMRGDFPQGWDEYEWRWRCVDTAPLRRDFAQPLWDGRLLDGATILLHAEQGYGDTLQFIRYVPLVAQRGGRICIECPAEIKRVIQTLAGAFDLIVRGQPLPAFAAHCPLASLPRVLQTTLDTIPGHVPYLFADIEMTGQWRERLSTAPESLRVGLAWAGSKNHANDRNRSISLSALAALASVPGVSFHSLQIGEPAGEIKKPPRGLRMSDWSDQLHDFADTAALIANLDLVISVDTAVAHLAGAMGKPVWLLLPFIPDWRWMLHRNDSPWYPTMRLFRQERVGDWGGVVGKVAEALATRHELSCNNQH